MIVEDYVNKITLSLLLVMAINVPIFSQSQDTCTYKIVGKVIDQTTKQPLAYANVVLKETTIGTVTGEDGAFEILDLCEKEYDLEISYIGYKSKSYHYDYHNSFLEIQLASDQTQYRSKCCQTHYSWLA